jgi:hypothetical protein
VQSDDAQAVERVVNEYLPRLMRGGRRPSKEVARGPQCV